MKKVLVILLLFVSLEVSAQKKDTTHAQPAPKASKDTVAAVKMFGLAMPQQNWEALLKIIQSADEKPSIIKEWVAFIVNNAKEIQEQKKTK